jgi:hypothetical protein
VSKERNSVRVTVSDPVTGEELESKIISDDYIVVCAGRRYVNSIQHMGRTHVLYIKYDPTPEGQGDE